MKKASDDQKLLSIYFQQIVKAIILMKQYNILSFIKKYIIEKNLIDLGNYNSFPNAKEQFHKTENIEK